VQIFLFLLPQLILFLTSVLVFGLDLVGQKGKKWLPYLALIGTVAAFVVSVYLFGWRDYQTESVLGGMIAIDSFSLFFQLFAALVAGLIILLSIDYMAPKSPYPGEYYSFILLACSSISLLAVSADFVMIFIAFELLSISSYILTGFFRTDPRSSEAAIKYFLYGSTASAMMLYGITMLYGVTASTNLIEIANALIGIETSLRWVLYPALVLLVVGFGFKVVAVPFHQWSPDAYEGAPTPVTAFLAVGSIGGGFAVLVRVMLTALPDFQVDWTALIAGLSIMSMTLGNLVAISQKNIKRMLAYSGIAQAGYILIGLVSWSAWQTQTVFDGISGVLVYLLVYLAANLGAFAVVIAFEHKTDSNQILDFAGLIQRSPLLAGTMAVFMLSLIGIPGTGGFVGKLMVFGAAMKRELYFLAVIAIINSVISGFYYLNVIRQMFFQPLDAPPQETIQLPRSLSAAIILTCVFTLLLGLYAQPIIHFVQMSLGLITG
jgi:proton-translocating NADH-quinone oxidoreductase chain N